MKPKPEFVCGECGRVVRSRQAFIQHEAAHERKKMAADAVVASGQSDKSDIEGLGMDELRERVDRAKLMSELRRLEGPGDRAPKDIAEAAGIGGLTSPVATQLQERAFGLGQPQQGDSLMREWLTPEGISELRKILTPPPPAPNPSPPQNSNVDGLKMVAEAAGISMEALLKKVFGAPTGSIELEGFSLPPLPADAEIIKAVLQFKDAQTKSSDRNAFLLSFGGELKSMLVRGSEALEAWVGERARAKPSMPFEEMRDIPIEADCPSCGSRIPIAEGETDVVCPGCGGSFKVADKTENPDVADSGQP
ncbi:hypothetical protein ES703_72620 [subsurface metagenome]